MKTQAINHPFPPVGLICDRSSQPPTFSLHLMKLSQPEASQEQREANISEWELEAYYVKLHWKVSLVSIVADGQSNWIESCIRKGWRQTEGETSLTILQQQSSASSQSHGRQCFCCCWFSDAKDLLASLRFSNRERRPEMRKTGTWGWHSDQNSPEYHVLTCVPRLQWARHKATCFTRIALYHLSNHPTK